MLTLALGIGANTAIFGVVNRLMLNPLPYPGADELVFLGLNMRGLQGESVSFPAPNPVVAAWRDEARSVDGIESFNSTSVLAYDDNGGRLLRGARITPGLPRLLQVSPVLGRGFTPADVETGASRRDTPLCDSICSPKTAFAIHCCSTWVGQKRTVS